MSDGVKFPQPVESDPEDVSWALSTGQAMWARGDHIDAIKWVKRASDSAADAGDDDRAFTLARAAAELRAVQPAQPADAGATPIPGAAQVAAPPPARASGGTSPPPMPMPTPAKPVPTTRPSSTVPAARPSSTAPGPRPASTAPGPYPAPTAGRPVSTAPGPRPGMPVGRIPAKVPLPTAGAKMAQEKKTVPGFTRPGGRPLSSPPAQPDPPADDWEPVRQEDRETKIPEESFFAAMKASSIPEARASGTAPVDQDRAQRMPPPVRPTMPTPTEVYTAVIPRAAFNEGEQNDETSDVGEEDLEGGPTHSFVGGIEEMRAHHSPARPAAQFTAESPLTSTAVWIVRTGAGAQVQLREGQRPAEAVEAMIVTADGQTLAGLLTRLPPLHTHLSSQPNSIRFVVSRATTARDSTRGISFGHTSMQF